MVSVGKTSSGSSQSSKQDVWGQQAPFLRDIYGAGQNLWAGSMPFIQRAQTELMKEAPGAKAASDYYAGVLGEQAPTMDQVVTNVMNTVTPGISSQFARAGRYGSGLFKQGLATEVGKGVYDRYQSAMDALNRRKSEAAGALPGLDNVTANRMIAAGMSPWQFLGQYKDIIGPPTTLSESRGSSSSSGFNFGLGKIG